MSAGAATTQPAASARSRAARATRSPRSGIGSSQVRRVPPTSSVRAPSANASGVTAAGASVAPPADFADQDDEADGAAGGLRVGALGEVAGQDGEAGADRAGRERCARGGEGARAVAAARVEAVVGARERGEGVALVEALCRLAAGLEAAGDERELGGDRVPVVECGLQGGGEVAGVGAEGEVARDHHQPAVARAVAQGCKLHGAGTSRGRAAVLAAVAAQSMPGGRRVACRRGSGIVAPRAGERAARRGCWRDGCCPTG